MNVLFIPGTIRERDGGSLYMMKMAKPISVEDFRLQSSFESVRQTLLDKKFADRLERPLVYWALPNDRRLPIAFLGRKVGELLATPFQELTATPGIGYKKIDSLVRLLQRATEDTPFSRPMPSPGVNGQLCERSPGDGFADTGFDAATISESVWLEWRERVRQFHVGFEKLGRLIPSLQSLPTVIWEKPLNAYLDFSLMEIRGLKTHGEKRVRAILEVFFEVNNVLSRIDPSSSLAIRLAPKFVLQVEAWILQALEQPKLASAEGIRQQLALPLVEQIRIDAGSIVEQLVDGRLGISAPPRTVLVQSRQLGVTRARIYQLFDECAKVMNVRWPEGRCQLANLAGLIVKHSAAKESLALVDALRELFYPEREESESGDRLG